MGNRMTEEEIIAMNPGKQMGDLVATEVMKWRRDGDHWVTPEGFWVTADGLDGWHPWQYASPATWQVLEKLRADFWCLEIHIADTCVVKADLLRTPPIFTSMVSRDGIKGLSEAICKVALLATLKKEGV